VRGYRDGDRAWRWFGKVESSFSADDREVVVRVQMKLAGSWRPLDYASRRIRMQRCAAAAGALWRRMRCELGGVGDGWGWE
jgi:hypothetical protein